VSNAQSYWTPADSLNKSRVTQLSLGIGATYAAASIGLASIWYADTEQTSFHFFNDWNEWNNMDKYGHFTTAYNYARLGHTAYRWAGVDDRTAMWIGVGIGNVLQTTVEVFDGFSADWGFSVHDMIFNVAGSMAYAGQHLAWNDQRIIFKLSTTPGNYPDELIAAENGNVFTTLRLRTDDLYGSSFTESWLKDYNQQTIWLSVNPASFAKENTFWPEWLNIAGGLSTENIFGGFENQWETDGLIFQTDPTRYPRTTEFFLSLDIDLTRIKTKSHFLKGLFTALNVIKIPAPAISINTQGDFKGHVIQY